MTGGGAAAPGVAAAAAAAGRATATVSPAAAAPSWAASGRRNAPGPARATPSPMVRRMAPPDAVKRENGPSRASENGSKSRTFSNTHPTPSHSSFAPPTTPPTRVLTMAAPSVAHDERSNHEKSVKTPDQISTTPVHRFENHALIGSQCL